MDRFGHELVFQFFYNITIPSLMNSWLCNMYFSVGDFLMKFQVTRSIDTGNGQLSPQERETIDAIVKAR
jgi:hypothetical protein